MMGKESVYECLFSIEKKRKSGEPTLKRDEHF